ncbi:MAG: C2 family cysteine protease [Cyanobacteriota bacterium]
MSTRLSATIPVYKPLNNNTNYKKNNDYSRKENKNASSKSFIDQFSDVFKMFNDLYNVAELDNGIFNKPEIKENKQYTYLNTDNKSQYNKNNQTASSPFRQEYNFTRSIENNSFSMPGEVGVNEQDGEIDFFRQGSIGDCWFLAGIDAVAKDREGAKMIKDAINKSPNGGWDVNFKGCPERTFHVSDSELQQYASWSKGDPDVRILEIAGNKWRKMYQGRNLHAGNPGDALKLLTGLNNNVAHSRSAMKNLLDRAADDPDGLTMTSCCYRNDRSKGLVANHAYSIESVDKANQTVTLKNPWDNSKPVTISYNDFLNSMGQTSLQEEAPFKLDDKDDSKPDNNDDKNNLNDKDLSRKFMDGLLTNMMQMFSQMMQMMMLLMKNNNGQNNSFSPQDFDLKPVDFFS